MDYSAAFNSDPFIQAEVKRLCEKHRIQTIVETGCYLGQTTPYLASLARQVVTIEIRQDFYNQCSHLDSLPNVKRVLGHSAQWLRQYGMLLQQPVLYFCDAHWGKDWPLCAELAAIAANVSGRVEVKPKPVIVIHDFKVPDYPALGYDGFDGVVLDWKLVEPGILSIYGPKGYNAYTNTADKSAGSRRGILYVTPRAPGTRRAVATTQAKHKVHGCSRHYWLQGDSGDDSVNIHLIVNPYRDPDASRDAELQRVFALNDANELIPHRTAFRDRPTIGKMLKSARSDCINVLANADMEIPVEACQMIQQYLLEKEVFALSRWDFMPDGAVTHHNHRDSQDVWCWRGVMDEQTIMAADFEFGIPGCDNRLAHLLHDAGWQLHNPSLDIITKHHHASGIRRYVRSKNGGAQVPGPYLLLPPTTVDGKQEYQFA